MGCCQCPKVSGRCRWLLVVVINILVRCIWRVPVHVVWLAWDAVLHPVLKMLLVLVWPRGAISWDFWRIVFCTIWLEHIKEEAGGNAQSIQDLIEGKAPAAGVLGCRDARPLSTAAAEFRQRISDELTMFSVVSVLLAGMTFAPLVTPFDDTIPTGPALDCFVVCCYLSIILSLLLTGMYARLATVLRYCPSGKYIVWYIYRFEPTFALMHIAFMINIHLVILAGSCALWSQWRCQFKEASDLPQSAFYLRPLAFSSLGSTETINIFSTNSNGMHNATGTTFAECVNKSSRAFTGMYIAAGMCVLYFLYTWANSMFCRSNGLSGVLKRAVDPSQQPASADSKHIRRLMVCCKDILAQQPFNVYEYAYIRNKDKPEEVHRVRTLALGHECPWPWPCRDGCFFEPATTVAAPSWLAWCFEACDKLQGLPTTMPSDSVITVTPDDADAELSWAVDPHGPDSCWCNAETCSTPGVSLHTSLKHNAALFRKQWVAPAGDEAQGHYHFAAGHPLDMVMSFSAAKLKWAVVIGNCTVENARDTTYSNGTYYLQVRIDCISYNRNHFGLANEALAGDLPINVMGVPMLAAVPASLRELRAYRPAVAASAAGPGAEAIPGAYEWPLRGLLPHGTRVTHI